MADSDDQPPKNVSTSSGKCSGAVGEAWDFYKSLAEQPEQICRFVGDSLKNPAGRLRQGEVLADGFFMGGLSQAADTKFGEVATDAGLETGLGLGIGAVCAALSKKCSALHKILGAVGAAGTALYAGDLIGLARKDRTLTRALDLVWTSKAPDVVAQAKATVRKQLGQDGYQFQVSVVSGLAAGVVGFAGMRQSEKLFARAVADYKEAVRLASDKKILATFMSEAEKIVPGIQWKSVFRNTPEFEAQMNLKILSIELEIPQGTVLTKAQDIELGVIPYNQGWHANNNGGYYVESFHIYQEFLFAEKMEYGWPLVLSRGKSIGQ